MNSVTNVISWPRALSVALLGTASSLFGGIASDYEFVFFENLNTANSAAHFHGQTLVGGDLSGHFGEFGHDGPFSGDVLTLAGTVVSGTHKALNGDATVGALGGGTVDATGHSLVIDPAQDYTAIFADYIDFSTTLAGTTTTGTTTFAHNILTLTGTGAATEVFNVDISNLGSLNNLVIASVTASSHIYINVTGSTLNFATSHLGDIVNVAGMRERVLWNFVDATNIEITGRRFDGSILAPNAHLNTTQEIYGDIYVKSGSIGNEVHATNFSFVIPEPSTAMSMITMGIISSVLVRRSRKR